MATITLRDIEKHFGDAYVIRKLNLDIKDNEFVVLLGPSGCGKSTTLNMIAGLEEVTEGDLRFDDEIVNALPPHRRDVAMVFQSYALYPHKSVYENIAFGLRMRKVDKAEIDRRVMEAATKLAISHLLQRKRFGCFATFCSWSQPAPPGQEGRWEPKIRRRNIGQSLPNY
jgi:multiple sugar transport system ATP-binding protein